MIQDIKTDIADCCFVFRGYNVTNLGRTPELLAHRAYGPTVRRLLEEASEVASEETRTTIDLVARVKDRTETSLDSFADAVALILASEIAQIELLREFHGIRYGDAKLSAGYSLGEIAANICSGIMPFADAMRIPVALAPDCAELGRDTCMGIVFSRTGELPAAEVEKLCVEITLEQKGTIAVSAYLSPNTILVLGQGETIKRFRALCRERFDRFVHFRKNPHRWPPLHTPIVKQRSITDRASTRLQTAGGTLATPKPPIASLVTGSIGYNEYNSRNILTDWTDHPQQVWATVCDTLSLGVKAVVHVGPEPNLFPATYKRLADNVTNQMEGASATSLGRRLVSGIVHRPWLSALLPSQAALLRAPTITHIILEDWLLETAPTQ